MVSLAYFISIILSYFHLKHVPFFQILYHIYRVFKHRNINFVVPTPHNIPFIMGIGIRIFKFLWWKVELFYLFLNRIFMGHSLYYQLLQCKNYITLIHFLKMTMTINCIGVIQWNKSWFIQKFKVFYCSESRTNPLRTIKIYLYRFPGSN